MTENNPGREVADELMNSAPTEAQRAQMAAYIDEKQPGLLDDLGIPRTEPEHNTTSAPPEPTAEQLAASIGCDPAKIIRSTLNKFRSAQEGLSIYTSFVDEGDPERAAVYETVWPQ